MTAGMEQVPQASGDDEGRKLRPAETVVTYIVILVGAVGLMFPFAWMLSTSLKPLDEVYSYPIIWIPSEIVFENYLDVFKKVPFARYLWNSFVLSVLGIIGNMAGSSLAAFSFARLRYPGRTLFFIMMPQHDDGARLGDHGADLHHVFPTRLAGHLSADPAAGLLRRSVLHVPDAAVLPRRARGRSRTRPGSTAVPPSGCSSGF